MSLSPYFSDDGVVNQLRGFFGFDEQWSIDFYSLLSQVEDLDEEHLQLKIKDRLFTIHKVLGFVDEVNGVDDE